MVSNIVTGTDEALGRRALAEFIKRPNAVGCINSQLVIGGGELISEVPDERFLAFLVSEFSEVT
jgi:hypothetical protein